ncbi:hypothetical protein V2H45_04240 [Tumidithrix elongata RA019]|uniref:Uncharacterized protein n=1 Tax=Tumidithrix elongata BACA0141 TaxID=2716417 RepID=A0AAW9PVW2_9CYAN|nr:hypothetical protein [Tumidithrix elongata RA019]
MKKFLTASLIFLSMATVPFLASESSRAQPLLPPDTPTQIIPLKGDLITVRVINKSKDTITFQALGDTSRRSLKGNTSVTLRNLKVPLSLAFYYQDVKRSYVLKTGLIDAKIIENKSVGSIDLVLSPTTDPDSHRSSLYIYTDGSVTFF